MPEVSDDLKRLQIREFFSELSESEQVRLFTGFAPGGVLHPKENLKTMAATAVRARKVDSRPSQQEMDVLARALLRSKLSRDMWENPLGE